MNGRALLVVLAWPVLAVAPAAGAQGHVPALVVPAFVASGATMEVVGTGFGRCGGLQPDDVEVRWDDRGAAPLAEVAVDDEGTFRVSIVVPPDAAIGSHTVVAWCRDGDYVATSEVQVYSLAVSPASGRPGDAFEVRAEGLRDCLSAVPTWNGRALPVRFSKTEPVTDAKHQRHLIGTLVPDGEPPGRHSVGLRCYPFELGYLAPARRGPLEFGPVTFRVVELVAVPDLRGTPVARVRQALTNARLALAGALPPDGVVVAQDPAAGTLVKPGSAVRVTVRRTTVRVPDLRGLDVATARERLARAGLVPGKDFPREGVVVGQRPRAGVVVRRGTSVSVTVAGLVTVPDVVGRTLEEALETLRAHGLAIGSTTGSGQVSSQRPAAGERVPAGTAVDVELVPPDRAVGWWPVARDSAGRAGGVLLFGAVTTYVVTRRPLRRRRRGGVPPRVTVVLGPLARPACRPVGPKAPAIQVTFRSEPGGPIVWRTL